MKLHNKRYQLKIFSTTVEVVAVPAGQDNQPDCIAMFYSKTHADFAKSLLETRQSPNWQFDITKHGHVLSDDQPFFCPHDHKEFNDQWLRIMTSHARLHLAQHSGDAEMVFIIKDLLTPPPTPWTFLADSSNGYIFTVDAAGVLFGANTKELLQKTMGDYHFGHFLSESGEHLAMCNIN